MPLLLLIPLVVGGTVVASSLDDALDKPQRSGPSVTTVAVVGIVGYIAYKNRSKLAKIAGIK